MAAAWSIAFLAAVGVSAIGTPFLRRLALTVGFLDHPEARKSHTNPVPYLGGVAIAVGAIAGILAGGGLVPRIVVIALAALVLAVVGLVDDRRTLGAGLRFAVQVAAAGAAVAIGVRVHATDVVAFDVLLTLLWLVGITNAFNLLDNMDGLAGGVATVASTAIFALAALNGQLVVGGLAAALVGACVGFLAYNVRPAAIYMGDAGSLFLGYLVAVAAIELDPVLHPPASFVIPPMLLGLAVLDTTMVSIARLRHGRTVLAGGKDHLSHRLVARGLSPGHAVAVLITTQAILSGLAVAAGHGSLSLLVAAGAAMALLLAVTAATAGVRVYDADATGLPRKLPVALAAAIALLLVAAAPAALALVDARRDASIGASRADAGLAAARSGDQQAALQSFDAANVAFTRAAERLDARFVSLGRYVPVLSSNLEASRALVGIGGRLAATGKHLSTSASPDDLRVRGGAIPVAELAALADPLEQGANDLEAEHRRVSKVSRSFLIPPLRSAIAELDVRLARAALDARRGADAAEHLPALLGAAGPRRYFLAVQNPAELRATGGFIGNFGEVVFSDGRINLERFGRITELNEAIAGKPTSLTSDASFNARYDRFDVERSWQNVNLSPDLPTVTRVIAELYPQSGGRAVDGVIAIDPFGLAALLELIGPVNVAGWPEPITSANVVEVSLQDAYDRFPFDDRVGFLGRLTAVVIERFRASDISEPDRVAEVMSRAIREGHLQMASLDDAGASFLRRFDADGALAPLKAGDSLLLLNQNASGNKVDYYLRRRVRGEVSLAPIDFIGGQAKPREVAVTTELSVELHNGAPSSGHDKEALGPYNAAFVAGQNRSFASVYTPHGFQGAKLNGDTVSMESGSEGGLRIYSMFISMLSGATADLRLQLTGLVALDRNGWYRLHIGRQATVAPDDIDLTFRAARGWKIVDVAGRGATIEAGTARLAMQQLEPIDVRVRLARDDQ